MGYQSPEVALQQCDVGRFILIRLVGPVSKGHDAKNPVTQRAKVGYCPCCAMATHVAIPRVYSLGEFNLLKHRGLSLWMKHGPWAGRKLAALTYLADNKIAELPLAWDWAAKALEFVTPNVLEEAPKTTQSAPALTIRPEPTPMMLPEDRIARQSALEFDRGVRRPRVPSGPGARAYSAGTRDSSRNFPKSQGKSPSIDSRAGSQPRGGYSRANPLRKGTGASSPADWGNANWRRWAFFL